MHLYMLFTNLNQFRRADDWNEATSLWVLGIRYYYVDSLRLQIEHNIDTINLWI